MNSIHWFQFILSYALQVSLVIGITWGLERWTQVSRGKNRLWTACYVSLLGLFAVGLLLPRLQTLHPWSTLSPPGLLVVTHAESVLGPVLLATWRIGAGVMLLRWFASFVHLHRFLHHCPVVSQRVRSCLAELTVDNRTDVNGQPIEFRISPEIHGAFCYQFHKPIVCLPQSLIDGDDQVLRCVLHHELTHLRTQHPLHLFLQKLVQSLLWFHPLVWISAVRANLVREFVCDDVATEQSGSTINYLRTLVRMIEQKSEAYTGTLTIGRTGHELRVRARRLADMASNADRPRRGSASWSLVPLIFASIVCSQLWLPTNPLTTATERWSPWPTWSATTLHAFDVSVRDFGDPETRNFVHHWTEESYGDD